MCGKIHGERKNFFDVPYPSILRIFILCYFRFLQRRRDYSCEISGIERFIPGQKLAISIFVRLFIDRVDCLSTENRAAERFKYLRAVCGSENWATSSSTSNPLANVYILFFDLLSSESFVMKFIFLRSTRFRSIILYEKNTNSRWNLLSENLKYRMK